MRVQEEQKDEDSLDDGAELQKVKSFSTISVSQDSESPRKKKDCNSDRSEERANENKQQVIVKMPYLKSLSLKKNDSGKKLSAKFEELKISSVAQPAQISIDNGSNGKCASHLNIIFSNLSLVLPSDLERSQSLRAPEQKPEPQQKKSERRLMYSESANSMAFSGGSNLNGRVFRNRGILRQRCQKRNGPDCFFLQNDLIERDKNSQTVKHQWLLDNIRKREVLDDEQKQQIVMA